MITIKLVLVAAGLLGLGAYGADQYTGSVDLASHTSSQVSVTGIMDESALLYEMDHEVTGASVDVNAIIQEVVDKDLKTIPVPDDRNITVENGVIRVTINGSCSTGWFTGIGYEYQVGDC